MAQSTFASNRREILQQMFTIGLGSSLLGLASCKDGNNSAAQVSAIKKDIVPCKPLNILPEPNPLEAPFGTSMRIRVRSTQTSNQLAVAEVLVMPKQMGPSPHYHKELDEVMFVQKGTASVLVGDEVHEVKAGGWHIRPRNVLHTFWNAGDEPLVFFDMYFNQNFEDFLEELFNKIIPDMVNQKLSRTDPGVTKRLDELNERFGVVMFHEKRQPIIEKYGLKA